MLGVVGVYSKHNATLKAFYNLYGVQHRGQESTGISAAGNRSLRTLKDKGLVSNVFDEETLKSFTHPDDYAVIGCASNTDAEKGYIPPIELESESKRYKISLAMDGLVLEHDASMTERIFGDIFLRKLDEPNDLEKSVSEVMRELDKAYYSLVMVVNDKVKNKSELIAIRDRRGIKPLYMGRNEHEMFIASESPVIDVLENMGERITERRDIAPGEMVRCYEDGLYTKPILESKRALCAFEPVYFSRADSVIEGRCTHEVRKKLGHSLVEMYGLKEESNIVVISVPSSGDSGCIGVAEAMDVVPDEGIFKNAYLGRTFLLANPEFRLIASLLKHNPIRSVIKGKKVYVIDDSIVRGTVSESIARGLVYGGAREVEFLPTYAPIIYPCFSGSKNEKLAAAPYKGKSVFEIGNSVKENLPSINKVRYNSVENVIKAIGLPKCQLCTMCITGKNPFGDK